MTNKSLVWFVTSLGLFAALSFVVGQTPESAPAPDTKKKSKRPPRPGVSAPGVKREMSAITPTAVFDAEAGSPDWQVITDDSVWVTNGPRNTVHRLDVKTNRIAANIIVGKKPCSGLATGFGSIWVPNCGDQTISRVSIASNEIAAAIPVGPSESEGGIAASPDAVWLVTDKAGKLSRIDPKNNSVVAGIAIPANSAAVLYAEGAVWVTTPEKNMLTRVDARTNKVTDSIEVGPEPRFLTYGAGSIWTLNQGDGTVSRVDAKQAKLTATVEVGVPGGGGEIAFGMGHVWATVFQIPISEIDPDSNKVVRQWFGPGGDSIRVAHGSIWLSNLREHTIWRIDPATLR
jgi:virginiamycin B lyase